MPFDVVGFVESAPGTGTPNIAVGTGEDFYTVVTTDWILVKNPYLLAALYNAVSTPAQLQVDMPELKPWYSFTKSCLLGDFDQNQGLTVISGRPLPLYAKGRQFKAGGQLRVMSRNGTDEGTLAGLWMGNGKVTQADLDTVNPTDTLRATSTTDQVVNTWTNLTLTWDNTLEEGRYAVVGMRAAGFKASGPGAGLARLKFKSGLAAGWRPGVPMNLSEAASIEYMSVNEVVGFPYQWPLMKEISFLHTEIPGVEVLSQIANTDHVVELVLQKIA